MIVQHDDRAISHRQRWERTERSATTSASRTVSNTRADAIGDAVMIYKTSSKQFRWTQESRDVAPSAGQDGGVQAIKPRQETCRDAVCAFETYTSARPAAIARAMRCPVRVHVGCDCSEPPQACQADRPATTYRRFVRCVTLQASVKSSVSRPHNRAVGDGRPQKWHQPSRAVCMPISATKSAQSRRSA
jgi:hypothetical protein